MKFAAFQEGKRVATDQNGPGEIRHLTVGSIDQGSDRPKHRESAPKDIMSRLQNGNMPWQVIHRCRSLPVEMNDDTEARPHEAQQIPERCQVMG